MATVNLTCSFTTDTGEPLVGAFVIASLSAPEKYEGFLVPSVVNAITNENGIAVLSIFPNELGTLRSYYNIRVKYRTQVVAKLYNVVVPNYDCNLWEIKELSPYPIDTSQDVVSVAQVVAIATETITAEGIMLTDVYDPNAIEDDAFNLDNHIGSVDGGTFN